MRKLKVSGSYLRNQTLKNLAKAFFCLLLFGFILFFIILRVLPTFQIGVFELIGLPMAFVCLIGGYFYWGKYGTYKGGWEGERRVTKVLNSTLNDNYYLINEAKFGRKNEDIDHIILGPNGVFVLETKNWSGKINCHGDQWQRVGRHKFVGNPSRQVKKNTIKIKTILSSLAALKNHGIWVEGIVVFTNKSADLDIRNPPVTILKLHQLPEYIATYKNYNPYTKHQLKQMGKELLKQTQ